MHLPNIFGFIQQETDTTPVIIFLNQLIGTYGVLKQIIADRGSAFTSNQFTQYCLEKGIKSVLTAISTPRAAGQVGRILDRFIVILPEENQ